MAIGPAVNISISLVPTNFLGVYQGFDKQPPNNRPATRPPDFRVCLCLGNGKTCIALSTLSS